MPSKRELGQKGILKMLNWNIPTGETTWGGGTSDAKIFMILSAPVTWNNGKMWPLQALNSVVL